MQRARHCGYRTQQGSPYNLNIHPISSPSLLKTVGGLAVQLFRSQLISFPRTTVFTSRPPCGSRSVISFTGPSKNKKRGMHRVQFLIYLTWHLYDHVHSPQMTHNKEEGTKEIGLCFPESDFKIIWLVLLIGQFWKAVEIREMQYGKSSRANQTNGQFW